MTQSTRGSRLSTKLFPRHFLNLTEHQPTPTKEVSVTRSVSLMLWRRNKSDPVRRRAQGSPVGGYSCFNGRVDKKNVIFILFFIIRDISLQCQTSKVRRKMFKVDKDINYLQKPHWKKQSWIQYTCILNLGLDSVITSLSWPSVI